jgi:hypothetical protein
VKDNVRLNVNIPWIKGLTVTGNASLDKALRFHKKFEKPWYSIPGTGMQNIPSSRENEDLIHLD